MESFQNKCYACMLLEMKWLANMSSFSKYYFQNYNEKKEKPNSWSSENRVFGKTIKKIRKQRDVIYAIPKKNKTQAL